MTPTSSAVATKEGEHEMRCYHGTTACGVEKWAVKTGIDPSDRTMNTRHVVNTSIYHLRSLSAPDYLPSTSSIAPAETTVFRESGTLLRVKEEAGCDYHLV